MKTVVIMQPNYLPWVGLFEQVRLADVFVHLDDAQFSKGSFVNRVQIKAAAGSHWLTVPLARHSRDTLIHDLRINDTTDWRRSHRDLLRQAYAAAPHRDDMLAIVDALHGMQTDSMAERAIASIERVSRYFALDADVTFARSSSLDITSRSSRRVLDIVRHFGGTRYVTGHGARRYLDHDLFEQHDIDVAYMNYQRTPYPQQHGGFDPHVSILDLIANRGRDGASVIASPATPWRKFLHGG